MKNVLLQLARKLNKNRMQRKWWQRAVRVMGTVVVFCTTYALILPAITMQQEPICGKETHEHTQSCYVQQPIMEFACGLDAGATVVHSHDGMCYDAQGTLICLLPEVTEHIHGDGCYSRAEEPACGFVHIHSADCATVRQVLTCGLEETEGHTHTEQCTTQQVQICETLQSEGHTHGENCGSVETVLICAEVDTENHVHAEECYETQQIPCAIAESVGHTHGEGCFEMRPVECPLEEREAHSHSEACYTEQEVFCDQTTIDGHLHEDACYPSQFLCTLEEVALHTHAETCYDAQGSLICTQPLVIAHAHEEGCLVVSEQLQNVLSCGLEVHIHEESCYPQEEEGPYEYICGMGVHTHVETCFNEEGQLVCTIPEHSHEAGCIVTDLDKNADVETEEQWKESFSSVAFTGNWPKDVLAVAQTQLDYKESEKNLVLAEGLLKGYTRYGAWYGDPYGDWDTMFVSFCLHYAQVQDFPTAADVGGWIAELEEKELYRTPDSYTPKPGDLIFIDYDQNAEALEEIPVDADLVAIVEDWVSATEEEPAQIKFIAGDQDNQVSYVTCDLDDAAIVGYGEMPSGEISFMTYEGEDFAVTVTLGEDADIPCDARLEVREILPGTEEYQEHYQKSVDALKRDTDEEDPVITFARFFDIQFLVDGQLVEPAAPVDIQIRYTESIAVKEEEDGLVVHFAQDGVEVLDADTYSAEPETEQPAVLDSLVELFTDETEQVDTFRFTQSSFSVSGTIVTYAARAVSDTLVTVPFHQLDASRGTQYVIYTEYNGSYYAITSATGNVVGFSELITLNDDKTISRTGNSSAIYWTFEANDGTSYYIQNVGTSRYIHAFDNSTPQRSDYGTITGGRNPSEVIPMQDGTILFKGNNYYTGLQNQNGSITFNRVSDQNQAARFYIATVAPSVYHVWFDGTNSEMMSYYGSRDTYLAVDPADNTITLPDTWKSPTKYPYALNGWYDIKASKWYAPGSEVEINQHTVFYADWIAADYDVGQNNDRVVKSQDTHEFVTTYVFDYNVLFNVLSQMHTGSISATEHSETWAMVTDGTVPHQNRNTLDFSFVDYDQRHTGQFSYATGRNEKNYSRDVITPGIIAESDALSGDSLLDLLFNKDRDVIGKKYLGTGNYLFQYMDSTTSNYDGEHDGYYYLDSRYNAASYNRSEQRFYLYNYLERTSDSNKDKGIGQYSDFLPFNSPYLFEPNQMEDYVDSILRPGYEYDAKDYYVQDGYPYSEYGDAGTNYFFGIRTDIEFFLPNETGDRDEYGNYGNISTRGEHMVFEFHGDDDLWVYVDGKLLLDVGGMHGVMYGEIDFSTGTVISGKEGGALTTTSFDMGEGTHTMTVYYMERGSSQSNCSIFFNIAPRYDLEIRKEDVFTAQELNGTEFSIYTDEACTIPAQLWPSRDAHDADMEDEVADEYTNTFVVRDGFAACWGVSAGKTYYIRETKVPDGYPQNDDILRITLNNRGTATIETTSLHGSDGNATEGYAAIKQDVNDTLKIVALTVTNQKNEDTTEMRVKKVWDPNATDLPNSITVYLTMDGKRVGRPAVLTDANGWTHTWTGLPMYEEDGQTPLEYRVEEVQIAGFSSDVTYSLHEEAYIEWTRSDAMADSSTYLLMNNGKALSYNPTSGFYWMGEDTAKNDATGMDAQWRVTTNQYGFRLTNLSGYSLTYQPNGNTTQPGYFYAGTSTEIALNQVIYYLEGRLVAHDHDLYFQLDMDGNAVTSDGLVFSLIRKDNVIGTVAELTNTLIPHEDHTFVEVNKTWADFEDHSDDAVTMHLYADGVDTGREAVLNSANNWHAVFDGLLYKNKDGNVIVYTIVEDEPENYDAEYAYSPLAGIRIVTWVKQDALTANGIYRIVSGANALALDASGALTVGVNDPNDASQWWTAVQFNNWMILKHSTKDVYLMLGNTGVTTTTDQNSATPVTLNGEILSLRSGRTNYYLQMTKNAVTVSQSDYNATLFTVALRTEGTGNDGTGVLVTNTEVIGYELPKTGGMGTFHFTFGGAFLITAALMCAEKRRRKLRRGGKYSR